MKFNISYEAITWYITLGMGGIVFLVGMIYLLLQKRLKEHHFIKAACMEFMAEWILILPNQLFNEIHYTNDALYIVESICTAFVKTFNMYLGGGYERYAYTDNLVFTSVYSIVRILVYMALFVFATGFLVTLMDGPAQWFAMKKRAARKQYIFSECNEKALSIAKSIPKMGKKNIVFVSDGKLDDLVKEKIQEIDGCYVKLSLDKVVKELNRRSKEMELFLFGDNEKDNLFHLGEISSRGLLECGCKKKIYVEIQDTPWRLYDNLVEKLKNGEQEQTVVNYIRIEENYVYNNLLHYSIFENSIENPAEKCKDINILLIGMNRRNFEFLKAVLHLAQMPGYHLNIMVLDAGANRELLWQKMPEVKDSCKVVGDAWYSIIYKENVSLDSCALETIVKEEFIDFNWAYVGMEDDLKNIGIAMRLNAVKCRAGQKNGYIIQVNVASKKFLDNYNSVIMKNIVPSGMFGEIYHYDFLTMSAIEKCSAAIHEVRNEERKEKAPDLNIKSWVAYCNNEYNRHSVYARTLALKYKVDLIEQNYQSDYSLLSKDKNWKMYEHMRWNMYTRTMGYQVASREIMDALGKLDKDIRNIAMIHKDLILFEELSEEEQNKDGILLTPEIVAELKKLGR